MSEPFLRLKNGQLVEAEATCHSPTGSFVSAMMKSVNDHKVSIIGQSLFLMADIQGHSLIEGRAIEHKNPDIKLARCSLSKRH